MQLPSNYRRELQKNNITKTCLYNFDPLKPHFNIVNLGFTGIYIIFLNFARKHRLWEISEFVSENVQFWEFSFL